MASGEQLKALLKSHVDGDDDRFYSIAMQVAAHEARRGHGRLAEELRAMIDAAKGGLGARGPVPIGRPRGELAGLLEASYPKTRLGEMVLGADLADQIRRVIREQRHAGRIVEQRARAAAQVVAHRSARHREDADRLRPGGRAGPAALSRFDSTRSLRSTWARRRRSCGRFSTRRAGRGGCTSSTSSTPSARSAGLRTTWARFGACSTAFLQMIEQDRSHSLVIAATNHPDILDSALFRRFDDVLHYDLPARAQIAALLKGRLHAFAVKRVRWQTLAARGRGVELRGGDPRR